MRSALGLLDEAMASNYAGRPNVAMLLRIARARLVREMVAAERVRNVLGRVLPEPKETLLFDERREALAGEEWP